MFCFLFCKLIICIRTMPRSKNIGQKRSIINISIISLAIEDIEKGMTIETAAKKHTIAKTTLWRHYKRYQQSNKQSYAFAKQLENNYIQIFTDEEEIFLVEYIKALTKLQYGLNKKDIRKFIYLIAQKNKKGVPKMWIEEELADIGWLTGFLQRHPSVPLKNTYGFTEITTSTNVEPKLDFNAIPNNINDSISWYLFAPIYEFMKLTNTATAIENKK